MSNPTTHEIIRVPAKINIYLQAGPIRGDGYHDITTVYQAISIYDELTAYLGPIRKQEPGEPDLSIEEVIGEDCSVIPKDDKNLIIKAARLLATHAKTTGRCTTLPGVRFRVVKNIPVEAGLGGGSADAAAALIACNQLWDLGLSSEELMELGARVGEDVPFHIHGGMAFGRGHQAPLTPIPCNIEAKESEYDGTEKKDEEGPRKGYCWVLGVLHWGPGLETR